MHIGLRVFSSAGWLGGVNYVLGWARACRQLPTDERPRITLLPADPAGERIAAEHAHLADAVRAFGDAPRLGLDLVYPATQLFEAPFGAPWAGWIPDWQCQHLPEMFDAAEYARRQLHYRFLATHAPALALSSRMALADTRRVLGGAPVPPVVLLPFPAFVDEDVVRAAPDRVDDVRRRHGLPERFMLVCNQFWRHKNHRVVFEALGRMRGRGIVVAFTGALTDERWPELGRELQELIDALGVQDMVRFLGPIARPEQLLLMRAAVAVVQPSRFEGWSSVVEEARALGRPILLSRFPVHEEQDPPRASWFDPQDAAALAELMGAAWDASEGDDAPDVLVERQREHVLRCARGLLELARVTRAAWDPARHDPRVLIPALVAQAEKNPCDEAQGALAARVRRFGEAMLAAAPERPASAAPGRGPWSRLRRLWS